MSDKSVSQKRKSNSALTRRKFCSTVAACITLTSAQRKIHAASGGIGNSQAHYRWLNVAMGGGGAIPGIVLHPRVPGLAYIHTDVGGCYRWDSSTKRWIPLLDHIPFTQWNLYGVDSIAVDPNDESGNIVYISTGKYADSWASPAGMLMKSTDRGQTWTRTTLSPTGGSNQSQGCGERLAVDPANGQHVVYASQLNGLFTSFDAAKTWNQLSAAPRGWSSQSAPGKKKGHGLAFVVFDPSSGVTGTPARTRRMYVGATGEGVYRSSDGGNSWQLLDGAPAWPRKGVIGTDGVLVVSHRRGVAKFAAGRWTNITPRTPKQGTCCAVAIDPSDSNHILATLGAVNRIPVFRSTDGGKTWVDISGTRHETVTWWAAWQWFSSPFSLAFDPHRKHCVWATDWYGTYCTDDITRPEPVWTNFVGGIEELCIIGALAAPPGGRCRLYSGAADEGGGDHLSLTKPPRRSLWVKGLPAGLDRTGIAVASDDSNFVVCVGTVNWSSPGTGGYSVNGGDSWTRFAKLPYKGIKGGRIVLTGNHRRILWVPQEGPPYYSDDLGQKWSKVKCRESLAGSSHGNDIFVYDQPVAVDASDANRVYILNGSRLFVSTDAGEHFSVAFTKAPADWNHKVLTSGHPGDVWVSGGTQGLFRSRNGGRSFARVSGVQAAYMFCFGKAPAGTNFPALFVQGEVAGVAGYFRSDDQGRHWVRMDMPLQKVGDAPNTMTGDWRVFGGVFVGTTGRGIFYGCPANSDQNI